MTTKSSSKKVSTYILDTNVLLTDPKVFTRFQDAELIVPHVVISELDKVKSSRGDNEARYRGREVSRFIFDLSEQGDLTQGVDVGKGCTLKVVNYEPSGDLPPALKNKTADDLIIALALELAGTNGGPGAGNVILMTNDLNMLIKAQSLGVPVKRAEQDNKRAIWSRLARRWQSQIFPILIVIGLALLLLLMAELVNIVQNPQPADVSEQVSSEDRLIAQYQQRLAKNPNDFRSVVALGDLYQRRHEWTKSAFYYSKAVLINSRDMTVRTNLAIAYFNTGRQSLALQVLNQIIQDDWSYAPAHYNLGAMYYTLATASKSGNRDEDAQAFFERAELELNVYLQLDPRGQSAEAARSQLQDIKRQKTG